MKVKYIPVFQHNAVTRELTVSVGKFVRARRESPNHPWKDAVTGKSLGRMSKRTMHEFLINNPDF